MNKILEAYNKRLKKYSEKLEKTAKLLYIVSFLRLIIFLTGLVLIYFTTRINYDAVIFVFILFTVLFLFLVKFHSKLFKKKQRLESLIKINKNEIDAINGNYEVFENAKEFLDAEHPFTSDLDIFGDSSLFQYINRTSTIIGKIKLAEWFIKLQKNKKEIISRQQAVAELKDKLDWRQDYQAIGFDVAETKDDKESILNWVKAPPDFNHKIYRILLFIIPLITITMLIFLIIGNISYSNFFLFLLVPLGIAGFNNKKINRKHIRLSKKTEMLKKYSKLINKIEDENFQSERLQNLKKELIKNHKTASSNIQKLAKILNALDSRLNMIAWVILNGFLIWDLMQVVRLENWQNKFKDELPKWFFVIAEIDALSSLGCYYYNNPKFIFPKINTSKFTFTAQNIGHPLIHYKARIMIYKLITGRFF